MIDRDQLRSLFFSSGDEKEGVSQDTLKAVFFEDDKVAEAEIRQRRKDRRKAVWEYFRMRELRWREREDNRILDWLYKRRIREGEAMVKEWMKIWGPKLAKKYGKVQFEDYGAKTDRDWYMAVYLRGLRVVRLT